MKNKKVLLPAIAALVLSSAAAVTGTVAWFTANLEANAASTNVSVVKTGSDLTATLKNGSGTTLKGTGPSASSSIEHKQLIDGSVDLTEDTPLIYNPTFGTDGSTINGWNHTTDGVEGTQFRATQFTITFAMDLTNAQAGTTFGVYVDRTHFVIHDRQIPEGDSAELGLRVGIKTATQYLVWAPYNGAATTLDYVDATAGNTPTYVKYVEDDIILDTDVTVNSATASAKKNKLKIGTMTKGVSETFDATIYTWFEGAVVNNNSNVTFPEPATYTLAFNAVKD